MLNLNKDGDVAQIYSLKINVIYSKAKQQITHLA
jgi:hypothetical protein